MTFVGWSTAIDTQSHQAFVQNYRAKHGVEPNNFAARAYATLHIFAVVKDGELVAFDASILN